MDLLAVAALPALACALRFYRLGDWSFWADEVFTLRDMHNLRNVMGYPLGYALIGMAVDLELFGSNEFAARFVPAVVGAISVPVLYLLGRKVVSPRAALFGAALLALSSYHIYYSQYARYYTLLMFLGMVGMWGVYVGIEFGGKKWLILGLLALALAFLTHWTAGLLVPAMLLYLAWSLRGGDKPAGLTPVNLAVLAVPMLAATIALAPILLRFLGAWKGETEFSLQQLALVAMKLVDRMDVMVLICAALGAWWLMIARDRRAKWLLTFAVVPVISVIVFVGFSHGGSRFAFVSLPAVVLLAGVGMDRLIAIAGKRRRKLAWLLVALVFFLLVVKDVRYYGVEQGQRPRWHEAITWAVRGQPEADYIVTTPEIFEYYTGREARALSEFDYAALERELSTPSSRDRWIIVERTANVRPTPTQDEIIERHAELVRTFPLRIRYFLDYSVCVFRVAAR